VAILTRFDAGEKRVLIRLKMGYVPKLRDAAVSRGLSTVTFRKAGFSYGF
jgi:hypothetical protein